MSEQRKTLKVHPAEFADLNRQFYNGQGPHEYFDNRFSALLRHVSRPNHVDPLAMKYGELKVTESPSEDDTDDEDRKERDRFAALDSTVLLHHASESLVRMYLAHAERSSCPWVALAELKQPRAFPTALKKLKRRLSDQDDLLLDDIMEVFAYSTTNAPWGDSAPADSWSKHREALAVLLGFAVNRLLDDSGLYNAAKHGFGVSAGPRHMKLGDLIDYSGPSISYLEYNHAAEVPWTTSLSWVDPERYLAATFLISKQLKNLWNCALAHYSHEKRSAFVIVPLQPDDVHQAIQSTEIGIHVSKLTTSVYTEDDELR